MKRGSYGVTKNGDNSVLAVRRAAPYVSETHFFCVIDVRDGGFTLGDVVVVIDVVLETQSLCKTLPQII
jgi:hypothetical protein